MYHLALVSALAFAAPGYTADITTIDCVQKAASPAARTALETDIERNLSHPDQAQSYDPAVVRELRTAAAACRTQHQWSEEAAQSAILYAVPTLASATAKRMAAANRLDYAALEARFMALPTAERIAALNETVLAKLALAAVEAGEVIDANANLAGGIFGLFAVREKARSDFAAK